MRTFFLLIILVFVPVAHALPSFDAVKASYKKSDAVLLDRHGKVIHELRVDPGGRRLDWAGIRDISPALIKAVIHSEDRRFYEHSGVDWRAVGSSAVRNLFSASPRGASTVTMQLASVLDRNLKPKYSKKTLLQKLAQMKAAKEIEKSWEKGEILEAYLNLITFRGELQGISAASRGLFDKTPDGIDEAESLILASLIRSPNAPLKSVTRRACTLGNSIRSPAKCEDIRVLAEKTLSGPYSIRQRTALAPHAAYKLLTAWEHSQLPFKKVGFVITTLDGELQRFASETLKHHLLAVRSGNVNDGAVLVIENRTGDVLAYVGGAGDESRARYVDGIHAKRQAGSTLKPFLYAMAFEKRILTPASLIDDSPFEVSTLTGIYKPENYENDFKGMVTARTALASSLNVPAVRTLSLMGVETFVVKLKELEFSRLERDDYYGPSLALGSADVSLWELARAYRALANNGVLSGISLVPGKGKGDRRRLFSDEASFLVSDILSDREARSATFSLENPLSTRFWSAVKTGTSKDMRDNWCIGYSERFTVGVWVGNFTGEPMWNVSGVTGAAPVWLEIMSYLHRDSPGSPPKPPPGVAAVRVEFPQTGEPARNEWFMAGTEPVHASAGKTPVRLAATPARPRITYPPDKTIIALDPDIPDEYQRLFFEAEPGSAGYEWVLDNESLGAADEHISWRPVQGRHLLSLRDARMNTVDSVKFEVRGGTQGQNIRNDSGEQC